MTDWQTGKPTIPGKYIVTFEDRNGTRFVGVATWCFNLNEYKQGSKWRRNKNYKDVKVIAWAKFPPPMEFGGPSRITTRSTPGATSSE